MEYEIDSDASASSAVVRAVSAVDGSDPCRLPPLTDVLPHDALDALFDPRFDGTARAGGRLTFVYNTCGVTIDNGEYLTRQPLEYRLNETSEGERSPDLVRERLHGSTTP